MSMFCRLKLMFRLMFWISDGQEDMAGDVRTSSSTEVRHNLLTRSTIATQPAPNINNARITTERNTSHSTMKRTIDETQQRRSTLQERWEPPRRQEQVIETTVGSIRTVSVRQPVRATASTITEHPSPTTHRHDFPEQWAIQRNAMGSSISPLVFALNNAVAADIQRHRDINAARTARGLSTIERRPDLMRRLNRHPGPYAREGGEYVDRNRNVVPPELGGYLQRIIVDTGYPPIPQDTLPGNWERIDGYTMDYFFTIRLEPPRLNDSTLLPRPYYAPTSSFLQTALDTAISTLGPIRPSPGYAMPDDESDSDSSRSLSLFEDTWTIPARNKLRQHLTSCLPMFCTNAPTREAIHTHQFMCPCSRRLQPWHADTGLVHEVHIRICDARPMTLDNLIRHMDHKGDGPHRCASVFMKTLYQDRIDELMSNVIDLSDDNGDDDDSSPLF